MDNTRPSSSCSSATSVTTNVPLNSSETHKIWNTCSQIITSNVTEEEEEEFYTIEVAEEESRNNHQNYNEEQVETVSDKNFETPTINKINRKRKNETEPIQETLNILADYVKGKKAATDKNTAFGQYVGLALADMTIKQQNAKKLKIMQILVEPDE